MTSEPGARPSRVSGLTLILLATAASGIAAYVVTWLVPRQVGFASYTAFAVFWSFCYLIVGALSGIQQEVSRGTRPVAVPDGDGRRARRFGLVAAGAVFVAVVATAPLWVGAVFPDQGWNLVLPLAVGVSGYVLVAVLCGSLYGISAWPPLAMLMFADAVLRLAAVGITLTLTSDVVALAWAVAVPFPGAIALLWPVTRRYLARRTTLDVGYSRLVRNVAQTVVAAAASAIMVSGFPLVLGLASRGEPPEVVGLYILAITLTRAPLIVVVLSLQSYLVVTFRDAAGGAPVLRILGALALAGAVLAAAGWWLGPPVFSFLFPGEPVPTSGLIAVLVFSSALVASLSVTGPALLARSRHLVYGAGWLVAAVVTIAVLFLPIDFEVRTVAALLLGPVAGLVVHGAAVASARRTVGRD